MLRSWQIITAVVSFYHAPLLRLLCDTKSHLTSTGIKSPLISSLSTYRLIGGVVASQSSSATRHRFLASNSACDRPRSQTSGVHWRRQLPAPDSAAVSSDANHVRGRCIDNCAGPLAIVCCLSSLLSVSSVARSCVAVVLRDASAVPIFLSLLRGNSA